MRHAIAGNRLGRNSSLRKATIRDLAKSTLIQQRICTTRAKAKEARKMVDHLITLAKKGTLAHKRQAFAILCDHQLVSQLFTNTAPRFMMRTGGYSRIIPLAKNRRGDNAQMVFLELTEKDEKFLQTKKAKAEKRRLKGKGKAAEAGKATEPTEEKKVAPEKEKPHVKKHQPEVEQGKIDKKSLGGGIKKMFQRKVGSE
jgi:large subunit ribosomal protein L17